MDSARWDTLQEIFNTVADLPSAQRPGEVSRLCGGDLLLAEHVSAMLAEDGSSHELLDAPLAVLAKAVLDDPEGPLGSQMMRRLGPYRLLRLLGEGGMGVVYLAERTDIGGLVAIKLLRDAWLSPMRRMRFAEEQAILAKLNHPAIARIYDASTTEDGTPWFVMEYADGLPLNAFVSRRHGSLNEDLTLFVRVCEAVRYAHGLGIIHRDLKPSNILVTHAGEVKLLDFGISKRLDEAGQTHDPTQTALRMMTPAYAPPEQSSGIVGVFTDVYALGVLLYETLAGSIPAAGTTFARPSERVLQQTGPARRFDLRRSQWADLDVLCMKALQPEPERRYASVDALMQDVAAYLESRPLTARPDSLLYTGTKFVRRNRLAVSSASAVVAAALLAGALFLVHLQHTRDAAVTQAARLQRLQRFTESLFDGGDPSAGPAINYTATQVLERGRTEAESLTADPVMQADMFAVLGGVYQKLGHLAQADVLLERALARRESVLGRTHHQSLESLVALGILRRDQGRMDEAETILRRAVALEQASLGWHDPAVEHALAALGSVLNLRGRYPEAHTVLDAALRMEGSSPSPSAQLAEDLIGLADTSFYQGAYGQAEILNQRAYVVQQAVFGEHHPSIAHTLASLGAVASNRAHYTEAEGFYRRALAITEAWYGLSHPEVAANLTMLAHLFILQKHFAQAEPMLQRALAIQRDVYGENHSGVATALNELGILAYTRDRDDEAERDYREALAIWTKVYGEHHQFVGLSYANLVGIYLDRKDYPQAESMCRRALAVYSQTISEDHPNTAVVHVKLGRILLRENRFGEAEGESLKGYRYLSTHVGAADSYLRGARMDLATIEDRLGRSREAAVYKAELASPPK